MLITRSEDQWTRTTELLVTNEPVEVAQDFNKNVWNMSQINKQKPKDHNI